MSGTESIIQSADSANPMRVESVTPDLDALESVLSADPSRYSVRVHSREGQRMGALKMSVPGSDWDRAAVASALPPGRYHCQLFDTQTKQVRPGVGAWLVADGMVSIAPANRDGGTTDRSGSGSGSVGLGDLAAALSELRAEIAAMRTTAPAPAPAPSPDAITARDLMGLVTAVLTRPAAGGLELKDVLPLVKGPDVLDQAKSMLMLSGMMRKLQGGASVDHVVRDAAADDGDSGILAKLIEHAPAILRALGSGAAKPQADTSGANVNPTRAPAATLPAPQRPQTKTPTPPQAAPNRSAPSAPPAGDGSAGPPEPQDASGAAAPSGDSSRSSSGGLADPMRLAPSEVEQAEDDICAVLRLLAPGGDDNVPAAADAVHARLAEMTEAAAADIALKWLGAPDDVANRIVEARPELLNLRPFIVDVADELKARTEEETGEDAGEEGGDDEKA